MRGSSARQPNGKRASEGFLGLELEPLFWGEQLMLALVRLPSDLGKGAR
jgi:hypothetical protein